MNWMPAFAGMTAAGLLQIFLKASVGHSQTTPHFSTATTRNPVTVYLISGCGSGERNADRISYSGQ